jgi:serine/threonine-protein kinase
MTQPASIVTPYPQAGEVIDAKYRIERMLGEGGMGAVCRATHLLRRAPVALKFMSPYILGVPEAVDRFLNEAVAASQIDSENVVKVFDVGKLPTGSPYLVMEYLEGKDLGDVLRLEGKPGLESVQRAVHFVLQALRGLQAAHGVGIVHRDMKPSNCFVIQKEGEPDFVKLLDFGISRVEQPGGSRLTRTNSALGTPLYMSPEQAMSARKADQRSDLYSAAVILYELLTGRTPYNSETGEFSELLYQIFTAEPPPVQSIRPDLPEPLCAVLHTAMAREPASRYQSAAEMSEALVPWADERSRQVVGRIRDTARRKGETSAPLSQIGSGLGGSALQPAGTLVAGTERMPGAVAAPDARAEATLPAGSAGVPGGAAPAETAAAAGLRRTEEPLVKPRTGAKRGPALALIGAGVACALVAVAGVAWMNAHSAASGAPADPIGADPLHLAGSASGARSGSTPLEPIATTVAGLDAAFAASSAGSVAAPLAGAAPSGATAGKASGTRSGAGGAGAAPATGADTKKPHIKDISIVE